MKQQAFIVLVHQARSFIYTKLLQQYLARFEIRLIAISSNSASEEARQKLIKACDHYLQTEQDDLTEDQVFSLVQELTDSYQIRGVLATYEGYRLMMARLNQQFQVRDASPDNIMACFDKHNLRNTLHSHGLSSGTSRLVNAALLAELRSSNTKSFIKPRRGIGSFSCFPYSPALTMAQIESLQQQMREDYRFKNIFCGVYDFIAETYIEGDEYSFEVLVLDGETFVIGTHAKYLEVMFGTTLETMNSLPAAALSDQAQQTGEDYVAACLKTLGIEYGAYHIETRYCAAQQRWNIIEINPRMGGALINQSVGIFTDQADFLSLWLESLLHQSEPAKHQFKNRLGQLRESFRRRHQQIHHASIFISKYGEPGRQIKTISVDHLSRTPDICEMAVSNGSQLPASNRGIFLFNALWKVRAHDIAAQMHDLASMLDQEMRLEYETQAE